MGSELHDPYSESDEDDYNLLVTGMRRRMDKEWRKKAKKMAAKLSPHGATDEDSPPPSQITISAPPVQPPFVLLQELEQMRKVRARRKARMYAKLPVGADWGRSKGTQSFVTSVQSMVPMEAVLQARQLRLDALNKDMEEGGGPQGVDAKEIDRLLVDEALNPYAEDGQHEVITNSEGAFEVHYDWCTLRTVELDKKEKARADQLVDEDGSDEDGPLPLDASSSSFTSDSTQSRGSHSATDEDAFGDDDALGATKPKSMKQRQRRKQSRKSAAKRGNGLAHRVSSVDARPHHEGSDEKDSTDNSLHTDNGGDSDSHPTGLASSDPHSNSFLTAVAVPSTTTNILSPKQQPHSHYIEASLGSVLGPLMEMAVSRHRSWVAYSNLEQQALTDVGHGNPMAAAAAVPLAADILGALADAVEVTNIAPQEGLGPAVALQVSEAEGRRIIASEAALCMPMPMWVIAPLLLELLHGGGPRGAVPSGSTDLHLLQIQEGRKGHKGRRIVGKDATFTNTDTDSESPANGGHAQQGRRSRSVSEARKSVIALNSSSVQVSDRLYPTNRFRVAEEVTKERVEHRLKRREQQAALGQQRAQQRHLEHKAEQRQWASSAKVQSLGISPTTPQQSSNYAQRQAAILGEVNFTSQLAGARSLPSSIVASRQAVPSLPAPLPSNYDAEKGTTAADVADNHTGSRMTYQPKQIKPAPSDKVSPLRMASPIGAPAGQPMIAQQVPLLVQRSPPPKANPAASIAVKRSPLRLQEGATKAQVPKGADEAKQASAASVSTFAFQGPPQRPTMILGAGAGHAPSPTLVAKGKDKPDVASPRPDRTDGGGLTDPSLPTARPSLRPAPIDDQEHPLHSTTATTVANLRLPPIGKRGPSIDWKALPLSIQGEGMLEAGSELPALMAHHAPRQSVDDASSSSSTKGPDQQSPMMLINRRWGGSTSIQRKGAAAVAKRMPQTSRSDAPSPADNDASADKVPQSSSAPPALMSVKGAASVLKTTAPIAHADASVEQPQLPPSVALDGQTPLAGAFMKPPSSSSSKPPMSPTSRGGSRLTRSRPDQQSNHLSTPLPLALSDEPVIYDDTAKQPLLPCPLDAHDPPARTYDISDDTIATSPVRSRPLTQNDGNYQPPGTADRTGSRSLRRSTRLGLSTRERNGMEVAEETRRSTPFTPSSALGGEKEAGLEEQKRNQEASQLAMEEATTAKKKLTFADYASHAAPSVKVAKPDARAALPTPTPLVATTLSVSAPTLLVGGSALSKAMVTPHEELQPSPIQPLASALLLVQDDPTTKRPKAVARKGHPASSAQPPAEGGVAATITTPSASNDPPVAALLLPPAALLVPLATTDESAMMLDAALVPVPMGGLRRLSASEGALEDDDMQLSLPYSPSFSGKASLLPPDTPFAERPATTNAIDMGFAPNDTMESRRNRAAIWDTVMRTGNRGEAGAEMATASPPDRGTYPAGGADVDPEANELLMTAAKEGSTIRAILDEKSTVKRHRSLVGHHPASMPILPNAPPTATYANLAINVPTQVHKSVGDGAGKIAAILQRQLASAALSAVPQGPSATFQKEPHPAQGGSQSLVQLPTVFTQSAYTRDELSGAPRYAAKSKTTNRPMVPVVYDQQGLDTRNTVASAKDTNPTETSSSVSNRERYDGTIRGEQATLLAAPQPTIPNTSGSVWALRGQKK
eukprot:GILI01005953.1.p1 GENE.GILI01005953.1~~GILI01005953.1.p1  ORF type:complete len:1869 (+),score=420.10 GILI01005953.1:564-5609(+)